MTTEKPATRPKKKSAKRPKSSKAPKDPQPVVVPEPTTPIQFLPVAQVEQNIAHLRTKTVSPDRKFENWRNGHSKWSPEIRAEILQYAREGLPLRTVAQLVGIDKDTLVAWLQDKNPKYRDFQIAYRGLQAADARDLIKKVKQRDPRWVLQRQHKIWREKPQPPQAQQTVQVLFSEARKLNNLPMAISKGDNSVIDVQSLESGDFDDE